MDDTPGLPPSSDVPPGQPPRAAEPPSVFPASETPPPAWPPAAAGRRRLLIALVALHAVALAAAGVVLLRGQTADKKDGGRRIKLLAAPKEDVVAWVPIHGAIFQSESGRVWERGMEQWSRKIRTLADKSEVKAIVLEINSPGGSVGAVQELYGAIRRVREEKKKPVVALIGDIGASGGYYLAVGCDKIVAHPGSLLGSIGVIFNTMNVEGLLAKLGLKADPIKSGKHKDIGSPTRPMTKEEKALLQALIDDAYGQFLDAVVTGRGLPEPVARPLADGRIFSGRQALEHKLVDALGDSKDAVALAGKLGGISGTPKVLRDTDSLESVLSILDYGVGGWLRPELQFLRELRSVMPMGLEYRWTGF